MPGHTRLSRIPTIEPLDRSRGTSALFQFSTMRLRDFIDPNRLPIRIDEQMDLARPPKPLEDHCRPHFGPPAIFDGINDELRRLGLLPPEMCVGSSPVKPNLRGCGLEPSGMSIARFQERAIRENGLSMPIDTTVDNDDQPGPPTVAARSFPDAAVPDVAAGRMSSGQEMGTMPSASSVERNWSNRFGILHYLNEGTLPNRRSDAGDHLGRWEGSSPGPFEQTITDALQMWR